MSVHTTEENRTNRAGASYKVMNGVKHLKFGHLTKVDTSKLGVTCWVKDVLLYLVTKTRAHSQIQK